MNLARNSVLTMLALGFSLLACQKEAPPKDLAPATSAALEAPLPASAKAVRLVIDTPSSSMQFLMDSPLEKIDGQAPGSATGELAVELEDLGKSTGIIKIDLDKLTLWQQKRAAEEGEFGERKKSDKQNEHARDWFQIVPREGETTPEQAAKNRIAEYRIESLTPSVPSVLALTGPERKVTATVNGTLRLHGRQAKKSAKVELTFRFAGDKLESVNVKTLEPFPVSLEEFEIHPRDAAGKFTKSVTDAIASTLKGKLQKEAPVMIDVTAKASGR
jgi:hypothetical protein